jgi:metal-sulfur cluster biosynthetic enzyme
LIYDVQVSEGAVDVTMTLTTPGCPLHTAIARGAQTALHNLPGVEQATVKVVWDPPWTPERMSPEARAHLPSALGIAPSLLGRHRATAVGLA